LTGTIATSFIEPPPPPGGLKIYGYGKNPPSSSSFLCPH